MRELGPGAAWENAERKCCQNATVECRDCAKPAKMRPLNVESERKLQKCYRMRERGAGAGCVNGERKSCQNATVECGDCAKHAKMQPLKAESERKLQKCDHIRERGQVGGVSVNVERKRCQNSTVECRDCAKPAKMRQLKAESE